MSREIRITHIDGRRFSEVMSMFGLSVEQAAKNMADALGSLVAAFRPLWRPRPPLTLAELRNAFGGNGTDAIRWPDEYQTTVCSAWLCHSVPDICPSDDHGLGCTCRCHRVKR